MHLLHSRAIEVASPEEIEPHIILGEPNMSLSIRHDHYLDNGDAASPSMPFPNTYPYYFAKRIKNADYFIPSERIGLLHTTYSPNIDRIAFIELPQPGTYEGRPSVVGMPEIEIDTVSDKEFCTRAIAKAAFDSLWFVHRDNSNEFDIFSDYLKKFIAQQAKPAEGKFNINDLAAEIDKNK